MSNKPDFSEFRNHMIKAAAEIGVKLEMGTITYGDSSFTFSSKAYDANNIEDATREEFVRVAAMKGNFPGTWFGGEFEKGGKKYKITGAFSRGRKYTIQLTDLADGKTSKCSPSYVRSGRPITNNVKPVNALVQDGGMLV